MKCLRLFRKKQLGTREGLYVSDQLECMKLWLGNDETAESSWVKIKGRAQTGDGTVPPDQEDGVHEAPYRQTGEASWLQALIRKGGCQPLWYLVEGPHNRAQAILEVLEHANDKVIEKPTRRGAVLDIEPINRKELVEQCSKAALAAVIMRGWSVRAAGQGGGHAASSM